MGQGPVFQKSRCVYRTYIQVQSFNNFDNDTMKLFVNDNGSGF